MKITCIITANIFYQKCQEKVLLRKASDIGFSNEKIHHNIRTTLLHTFKMSVITNYVYKLFSFAPVTLCLFNRIITKVCFI